MLSSSYFSINIANPLVKQTFTATSPYPMISSQTEAAVEAGAQLLGAPDAATRASIVASAITQIIPDSACAVHRFVVVEDEGVWNAIGVAGEEVAGYDGAHRPNEVKTPAAVPTLIGFISRLAVAGRAGAENGADRVIVDDVIVANRGIRSIEDHHSFVQSVLHGEACNCYVVEPWMVETV